MARSSDDTAAEQALASRDASHADRAFASDDAEDDWHESPPTDVAIAFLADSGVSAALLRTISEEARYLGVTADVALLATGAIGEDDFYRALARSVGAAFVTGRVFVAPGEDYGTAAAAGIARLTRWPGGPRWITAPRGRDIGRFARQTAARDWVITTPRRFEALLREADPARVASDAAATLDAIGPLLSAREKTLPLIWPSLAGALAAIALLVWVDGGFAAGLGLTLLGCCFAVACAYRIAACAASFEPSPLPPALPDSALPTYTVIVALYREANMADDIVTAIQRLDYPHAKLDVKFVVEANDDRTRDALVRRTAGLPYDIIVVPEGQPRTKPRALNVAMAFSRGELLTIFDAEDRPDPLQLRRAAAIFARAPPDVVCLQARLAIDNPGEGLLEGLYALDYAALFCVINPGAAALGLPIFLGGTSNHFRRADLVDCGSWDAWNMTEDADLGVRLARRGFYVWTFDSATNEEAPVTFTGFFKQRVRWKKGWMQTFGVHARDPSQLWRNLGPRKLVAVAALFAAGLVGSLAWPFFAVAIAWDALVGDLFAPTTTLGAIRSVAVCLLAYCGAIAMLAPLLVGAARAELKRHLPLLLLLPLWHVLLCLAAWVALFELARHPYRWSKTEHGQARRRVVPDGKR